MSSLSSALVRPRDEGWASFWVPLLSKINEPEKVKRWMTRLGKGSRDV